MFILVEFLSLKNVPQNAPQALPPLSVNVAQFTEVHPSTTFSLQQDKGPRKSDAEPTGDNFVVECNAQLDGPGAAACGAVCICRAQ
jgi:hypothetical protein